MIRSDEPIKRPEDDVLGRGHLAATIAGEIRRIDPSQGAVIGVLGPWGSGKTSLVNLIRNELGTSPPITVLDFNPWLFSGADQLVESFFIELAAQLRIRPGKLQALADEFGRYGEVVAPLRILPVVGPWIEGARGLSKMVKDLYGTRKVGIAENRRKLESALRTLDAPIVVVIDDVDRLNTNEIRDIFRLVRLTANFPNVLYLVAFDRERVENALAEDGLPGRDYLEKIIQVIHDIPLIPAQVLEQQIFDAISDSLADISDPGPFDRSLWDDMFVEVVRPLIRNMRDVRRYAASLSGTVRSLGGGVELVDVFGLEAIRVFVPDLFAAIAKSQDALTTPSFGADDDRYRDPPLAASVNALLDAAAERRGVATAMIWRMFPAAQRHISNYHYGVDSLYGWLRSRRVAHPDVLKYYLERVAGRGLVSFWSAERALPLLTDREQLESFLRTLDRSDWEDVVSALEAFQDDFPADAAEPATIVLLNLMPEVPERPRGMLDSDYRSKVWRVVLRLLRRLPPSDDVERVVVAALSEVSTLSGKLLLLNVVGHDENSGHGLVSPTASRELEAALRSEIRAAAPETLAAEPELFCLLSWAKRTAEATEPCLERLPSTVLDCAILKGAVSTGWSRGMETRFVRADRELLWDLLVDLVGGEDAVRRIVDACRGQGDDVSLTEAIELAEKYLAGWRPRSFR